MFEFFKNLFVSKPSEGEDVFEQKADTNRGGGVARSTMVQRSHFQPEQNQVFAAHANGDNAIDIPLQIVLGGLPPELKGRVQQVDVGDATISIPLDKVLAQLPLGSVKLTFGELRRAGPQLFTAGSDCDQVQVPLPLNEILMRINPAMLSRRNQKRIDVPDEISSPFGERGQGLIFTIGPGKTPPATAATPAAARAAAPTPSAAPAQAKPEPTRNVPIAPVKSPAPAQAKNVPPAPPKSPAPAPALSRPVQFSPAQPTPPPKPIAPPAPSAPVAPATPIAPPGPIPFKMEPFQPKQPLRPSAPVNMPRPLAPTSGTPPLPPPSAPAAPSHRPLTSPLAPLSPIGMPQSMRPTMPQPAKPVSPVAPVAPVAPAAVQPVAPVPEGPFLTVALSPLLESWPEALRQEVLQLNLLDTKVALPVPVLEQALKRGKVVFPWQTLRSWIRPAPLQMESAHDEVALELPLKVILPLFLAHKKQEPKSSQQKVEIDENIPNLFFGFPQPETPGTDFHRAQGVAAVQAPSAPRAAAVQAPSAPDVDLLQPAVPPAPSDTNYYVWDDNSDSAKVDESDVKKPTRGGTDFAAKYATPNEIVSRAAALEGVAGALVALPDGLMVASKVSQDLNGDTLAAFLPQIFGKVSQCTKELRMGELNNLNFTVGNIPWKIFRVNAIFFAAFGRVGQPLPTAQLAALAAELDHKR